MNTQREWLTVAALAGLPGMPGTMRGVLLRTRKAGYISRGRLWGKGLEYAFESLPAETQAYLNSASAYAADEKAYVAKLEEAEKVAAMTAKLLRDAEIIEERAEVLFEEKMEAAALAAVYASAQRVPVIQGMTAFKGWLLARVQQARAAGHSYPEQRATGALDEVAFYESAINKHNGRDMGGNHGA